MMCMRTSSSSADLLQVLIAQSVFNLIHNNNLYYDIYISYSAGSQPAVEPQPGQMPGRLVVGVMS